MDIRPELLERYGKPVPRYTSYPTAPHFRHELTSSDMDYLLGSQKAGALFSLYIHIPFCRQLCSYCGCFTRVVNHQAPVKTYVTSLIREIRLAGEAAGNRPPVGHIHFGGGSPNLVDEEDLAGIFGAIAEGFTVLDGAECAMEMDPRILSEDKVKAFAAAGINRASLGVQDFQPEVQRAVNRIQPYEKVAACVRWLRDAGINTVNFDLMYGLPCQNVDGINDNVRKAVSLSPDRLALFGYAHVPWMRPHQKALESYHLPGSRERLMQFETASASLEAAGYKPIGMDHFAIETDTLYQAAQSRTLKRNFQGYTTDSADVLLGFGLSAISRFPQAYIQNTTGLKEYKEGLAAGLFPVAKGCLLSGEDRLRHDIIENLMCHYEADTGLLCRKHKMSFGLLEESFINLSRFEADGLVRCHDGKVAVMDQGRPFIRTICASFDAYFRESENRHAVAV